MNKEEEPVIISLIIAKLKIVMDSINRTIQQMEEVKKIAPITAQEILIKLNTNDLSHIVDRAIPWYSSVNHSILMLADVRDSMERIYHKETTENIFQRLVSSHERVGYYIEELKKQEKKA